MKTVPKQWTIYTVVQRKRKINPKPQYQRGAVWNLGQKQKLIDSILRGYDIPKFYLRETDDGPFEHEVVDGQQRLRAIWEFSNNEYELDDEESGDLPIWKDGEERDHSSLTSDAQDDFGLFELSIVLIENTNDLEIRDLFLRLQLGTSLNPAEKRNAMIGNMRDFVADLSEHKVFQYVRMGQNQQKRNGKDDWIAHVLCLEVAGNTVDVKAVNLKKMYEDNQGLDLTGNVAKKAKRVLSYMSRVLEPETPEMDIKWGFVDLYWLISVLLEGYDLSKREKDIQNFYITFEQRRRSVDDIETLIESKDFLDKSLFEYIQAFQRSGSTKTNIQKRHEAYIEWIHYLIQDLIPKDPKRSFNRNERMIIWRLANESCQKCDKSIGFNEMEADHVLPHSHGGQTLISNGQSLCGPCNKTKSDKR